MLSLTFRALFISLCSVALFGALFSPSFAALPFSDTSINIGDGGFGGSLNIGGFCIGGNSSGDFSLSSNPAACSRIGGVFGTIFSIINDMLVPTIFALAFIVFLWGVFTAYILNGGDTEKRAKGHQLILWGLIGFAVMVSIWGLVNVLTNTFDLDGGSAPPPPSLSF